MSLSLYRAQMRLVLVLDCDDAHHLADFWEAALGFERGPFRDPYVLLTDPRERCPDLLLQQVPEAKHGKNRMHLDIRVADVEPELVRFTTLGARLVQGPFCDHGDFLTAVMADPQGNEFCIISEPDGRERNRTLAED